jgi:hypothetical protein
MEVFADTFYFVALLSPSDNAHEREGSHSDPTFEVDYDSLGTYRTGQHAKQP